MMMLTYGSNSPRGAIHEAKRWARTYDLEIHRSYEQANELLVLRDQSRLPIAALLERPDGGLMVQMTGSQEVLHESPVLANAVRALAKVSEQFLPCERA